MMFEHVFIKHMPRGEWLPVHHDQIFGGSAVPQIEELVGIGIDAGFVDRSTRRSAASVGVPQCTVETYNRLCALAGSRPAAGGRAGLAQ
jgi:hypothetical protein